MCGWSKDVLEVIAHILSIVESQCLSNLRACDSRGLLQVVRELLVDLFVG